MLKPTKSREEIRRDLIVITTQMVIVGGPMIASIYLAGRVWLFVTGTKPDDPITVLTALLLGLTLIAAMVVSGSFGGLLWVLIMRPFLSRAEIEKWYNYGIKSSTIKRWNNAIFNWIYKF